MELTELLEQEVRFLVGGDPWHGPSVLAVLEGVDVAAAASRPIPDAHSIWELVLHMTAWVEETTSRLRGGAPLEPERGDWPTVREMTPAAWQAAVDELRQAHDGLTVALRQASDGDLAQQVGGSQVDRDGHPVTVVRTVMGLLQHDTYHAGQIVMLKKMLAASG